MYRRKVLLSLAALAALVVAIPLFPTRAHFNRGDTTPPAISREGLIAAPGRVEAVSEEIRVSSELGGRLKNVLVEEGDYIRRGQLLAQIENDDYIARVAGADAALAEREAELQRTISGARTQERRASQASLKAAGAILENSRREAERRRNLAEHQMVSRDEAERYERAYQVAHAEYERAQEEFSLVTAEPRQEDRRKAEAGVASARAQLAEARAYLEKTYIRSPLDGIVLHKFRHAGESVSTQFDSPIVTLADDSVLRVRLDVDETDVAKLRLGQTAFVTAEAYGSQRFTGQVIRIGRILGRKNVRTDEPTEHIDTKILETLVELDRGQKLPLGLRVDSFIRVGGSK